MTIPVEIERFFNDYSSINPFVSHDRKNIIYSSPKIGIAVITDPFGGCHIDVAEVNSSLIILLKTAIHDLSESLRVSKTFDSIWIDVKLPAPRSLIFSLCPESFKIGEQGKGDLIYDHQLGRVRIWQWLNQQKVCSITPNIGATAIVIDKLANKVLLIVNVQRNTLWDFPCVYYDPIQDNTPNNTAIRGAQQEGGFTLPIESISQGYQMGQMLYPKDLSSPAINQLWLFSIDNISKTKLTPPADLIAHAEWVDIDYILNYNITYKDLSIEGEIKLPLIAAMNKLGCDEVLSKGKKLLNPPI